MNSPERPVTGHFGDGSGAVARLCRAREEAPEADPAKIRAQLLRLLPAQVKDREGWANDIQAAFEAQRIAPSKSNLCAVLAVTEQESTFTADPQVPNLGRIARQEIDRRAARLHIPKLLVDGALKTRRATARATSSGCRRCAAKSS